MKHSITNASSGELACPHLRDHPTHWAKQIQFSYGRGVSTPPSIPSHSKSGNSLPVPSTAGQGNSPQVRAPNLQDPHFTPVYRGLSGNIEIRFPLSFRSSRAGILYNFDNFTQNYTAVFTVCTIHNQFNHKHIGI
jgi:hypothetical protein